MAYGVLGDMLNILCWALHIPSEVVSSIIGTVIDNNSNFAERELSQKPEKRQNKICSRVEGRYLH